MRRDYFTLEAANVEGEGTPTIRIDFDGPEDRLRERLGDEEGFLDAETVDVAYRLQGPADDPETGGVLAVTNRVTGEYVLESNAGADAVLRFIAAARERSGDASYRVSVTVEGDPLVDYEKRLLLVYDVEGELLRGRSLIPSGVEL